MDGIMKKSIAEEEEPYRTYHLKDVVEQTPQSNRNNMIQILS
jgi:hypothetical protein